METQNAVVNKQQVMVNKQYSSGPQRFNLFPINKKYTKARTDSNDPDHIVAGHGVS